MYDENGCFIIKSLSIGKDTILYTLSADMEKLKDYYVGAEELNETKRSKYNRNRRWKRKLKNHVFLNSLFGEKKAFWSGVK